MIERRSPPNMAASRSITGCTRAASKRSPSADWFERFRDGYAIHNLTALRTELSFFLIRWDDANELHWMELGDPRGNLKPFHFEIFFDKAQARDLHYAAALDRARWTRVW